MHAKLRPKAGLVQEPIKCSNATRPFPSQRVGSGDETTNPGHAVLDEFGRNHGHGRPYTCTK